MTNLVNHPGKWLRDDAAQSLARLERDTGVISVNSAGRTVAEQQALINRWNAGGAKNRPPYLYRPQTPASKSNHVQNGSVAVDTNHITHMLKYGPAYGWFRPFSGDPVHFEYNPAKDGKRPSVAPAAGAKSVATERQQNFLNVARGEKLVVDGKAGPNTIAAYKRYQEFLKSYGYAGKIDGAWGPGTQAAHQKYYDAWAAPKAPAHAAFTVLKRGSKGPKVLELQDRLNGRFPAYSKLARDSDFGPAVEKVVKEFQKRSGLAQDGIVGEKTLRALGLL